MTDESEGVPVSLSLAPTARLPHDPDPTGWQQHVHVPFRHVSSFPFSQGSPLFAPNPQTSADQDRESLKSHTSLSLRVGSV